jgi:uncharacterized membrane protein
VVSGCAELAGGIGLLAPSAELRRLAGWGLALLLVAVFPANIYMAVAHVQIHGFPAHPWKAWVRLPLQPLLFIGVIWATNGWRSICTKEEPKT